MSHTRGSVTVAALLLGLSAAALGQAPGAAAGPEDATPRVDRTDRAGTVPAAPADANLPAPADPAAAPPPAVPATVGGFGPLLPEAAPTAMAPSPPASASSAPRVRVHVQRR
jgi:hypothetical protein